MEPGFRRSCRARGAAGAARRRQRRRRCCCCWAGGCSAPRPPRVSPAAPGSRRPPRAPPEPQLGPCPFPPPSPLTFPPPSCPLSCSSPPPPAPTVSSPPPSPSLLPTTPAATWPHPTGVGVWETDIPAQGCRAPGPGFSFSSLSAPKVPGFPPINFPGALPLPPHSDGHTRPGGLERHGAPSSFPSLQGLPCPAPAHFLATEARVPAGAARRLRPPSPSPRVHLPQRSGL